MQNLKRLLSGALVSTKDKCWIWLKSINRGGYGKFSLKGKQMAASRASYILHNNLISLSRDQIVCHKCNVRKCINPNHLYLGDHKTNAKDCAQSGSHGNKKKTVCSKGHALSKDNIYLYYSGGHERRICKKCRNFYTRMAKKKSKYRSKRRALARADALAKGKLSEKKFKFYNRRADIKA